MNNSEPRKYHFKWGDIGDIELGRPNLGSKTFVSVYRLMQYTLKDVLVNTYSHEKASELFYNAGKLAGSEFCKNMLDIKLNIEEFTAQLHQKLALFSIGILKIEKFDYQNLNITLTISEDIDCSGLPISGETVCDYDEGFLAGIFKTYTNKEFEVKEIDCWSTGERTCRFVIKPIT